MFQTRKKREKKEKIKKIAEYLINEKNYSVFNKNCVGNMYSINELHINLNEPNEYATEEELNEYNEYIEYIVEDDNLVNKVIEEIHKQTTKNLKDKMYNVMGIRNLVKFNEIRGFKLEGLSSFPTNLYKFKKLESLILLNGSNIDQIPKNINNLTNLNYLKISNCSNIDKLPNSLLRLRYLTTLELENLELLTEFPEIMNYSSNLECLKISNCPNLTNLPVSFSFLSNLLSLELIGLSITELPENINNFINLQTLKIINCQMLSELPQTFSELNNLVSLEIIGTNIETLPETMEEWNYLKNITLKNNPRMIIPQFIENNTKNINIILDDIFYKKEMITENISPENQKSTLILCINCHGMDLCDEPINVEKNKLLYFSYAPKYSLAFSNKSCPSINKINELIVELNENKSRISDVIEKMSNIDDDVYKINKNYEYYRNREDVNTELINQRIKQYRTTLLENNANLVFKVRALKNDREYQFNEEEEIENYEGKFGIYILDIRNPKNEIQNNYKLISKKLNSHETINGNKNKKLSEILNDCYNTFNFDYVAIIDMSCRISNTYGNDECTIEKIYSERSEKLREIREGREPFNEFKSEGLGGRKIKKNRSRIRKTKKNRRTKKFRRTKNLQKTKKNK